MKYKCKSILIKRKKNRETDEDYLHITIYSKNNPTISGELPVADLDFKEVLKCHVYGLTFSFLTVGNDIEINNLEEVTIETKGNMVLIEGIQSN